MPQFQYFPSELLLAIASLTPQPALKALAQSCPRLNEAVTPLLYESIFFWQGGPRDSYGGQCVNGQASLPLSGSRIYDLDAFTQSVLSSETLRSLVKSVDLRWCNKYSNVDDSVRRLLEALASSHLRTLHLSPADFFFEIPTLPAVTSLAFQHDGHGGYDTEIYAAEFGRLYSLLCIPSLTSFCLEGWRYWGCTSYAGPARVNKERAATSNIDVLILFDTGAPGEDLQELLSWPKALRRFTFAACPYDGVRYENSTLDSGELQHALQRQRQTLEYLDARGADSNSGSDISKSIMLRDFPALKHLYIRVDFLVMPTQEYEDYRVAWEPDVLPTHRIIDALPQALEKLVLDPEDMFQYYTIGEEDYKSGRRDLTNWLVDIAASKPTLLRALSSVRLTPSQFDAEEIDHQVINMYREAGVKFCTNVSS